jgi:hypothetical protein
MGAPVRTTVRTTSARNAVPLVCSGHIDWQIDRSVFSPVMKTPWS